MAFHPRKSTPKVRDGKVQRKNRTAPSPGFRNYHQERPEIVRERPGPGHRHVLKIDDVKRFIALLPDWQELSRGLDAIVLAPAEGALDGWHTRGIVAVCAWPRALAVRQSSAYVDDHADTLRRLEIPVGRRQDGAHLLEYTETTVRAFQLMHILLHELGHHHDRMSTRSQTRPGRGEGYAELYANLYADVLWDAYEGEFGW